MWELLHGKIKSTTDKTVSIILDGRKRGKVFRTEHCDYSFIVGNDIFFCARDDDNLDSPNPCICYIFYGADDFYSARQCYKDLTDLEKNAKLLMKNLFDFDTPQPSMDVFDELAIEHDDMMLLISKHNNWNNPWVSENLISSYLYLYNFISCIKEASDGSINSIFTNFSNMEFYTGQFPIPYRVDYSDPINNKVVYKIGTDHYELMPISAFVVRSEHIKFWGDYLRPYKGMKISSYHFGFVENPEKTKGVLFSNITIPEPDFTLM